MKTLSPALATHRIDKVIRREIPFPLAFLVFFVVAGVAFSVAPADAAPLPAAPVASATSVIGRSAQLNGAALTAGATLFPGDVVRLGESSTAALRFGDDMVFASAETELVIESDGVTLRSGFLQVRAGALEPFTVAGPFFHVNVAAERTPSSAEIRVGDRRAEVAAIAGAAELTAENVAPVRLLAGEKATLDATGASAEPAQAPSNPPAGSISRLAPQVQIDRSSQHIVAAMSDRVYWNDNLRSGPTGRAHVTLNDGSQLNLGSDSSLRIVQHDASSQQTQLDLMVGRLRGKVTKLSKPGAKFEVHTPMGIAGLVGTDFDLFVTNDYTDLMVFEGAVRFTPASGQAVAVNAGMKVRFFKSGVADGPTQASPQELQAAKDLTEVGGAAAQAAPTAAAAAKPLTPLIITLTGAAAGVGIGVWQATRPTVSESIP